MSTNENDFKRPGLNVKAMSKVSDVAKKAHVDPETVRYWLRTGKVKGWQDFSHRWHIDKESLEDFLEGRKCSVQTLAKAVEVDPETVRGWLREGKLKGFKQGNSWVITDDKVKFRKNQETGEVEVYVPARDQ